MLVLSRKKGETIIVADIVQVTVVEIRGDKVKIGIVADKDINVDRQEVWEAKQREAQKAEKSAE